MVGGEGINEAERIVFLYLHMKLDKSFSGIVRFYLQEATGILKEVMLK